MIGVGLVVIVEHVKDHWSVASVSSSDREARAA